MSFFETVLGQHQVKEQITTLIRDSALPHSLLLYGETGLESTSMAIAIGSLLVGRQIFSPDEGRTFLSSIEQQRIESGESESAVKDKGLPIYIDQGQAFWIRPMKTQLSVEQWYALLEKYINVSSDTPRVVIVEGFQTANTVLANAMLKTIEEPPRNMYFIIVTTNIDTVLPTIVSRCMLIGMQPVPEEELVKALTKEGYTGDIRRAVRSARGNPTLARQWAQAGGIESLEKAMEVLECVVERSHFFTTLALSFEGLSKEVVLDILGWLRVLARDMLALRYGTESEKMILSEYRFRMQMILQRWSSKSLQRIVPITLEAEQALRLNVRLGLVIDGVILALREAVKEDI